MIFLLPLEPILEIDGKSDAEIQQIFSDHSVALTPDEGRQIVGMLGRNPTLTEATIWGIQGSEHSSYKSSRKYLRQLPTTGENVLLGPCEDAGVVKFHESKNGETYGIIYAHESHNHPSQVVPYEGAATGVGGISRDIACMGARVIGALDALRFGDISRNQTKRIVSGVVSGIGGYGNPLGIPNLGGDCFFDESFNDNCLVNVVALGVVRWKDLIHSFVPKNAAEDGYEYILVGKPTDRSGFGGAAFASVNLEEEDKEKNKGAVQEPNPFLERHLFASFYDLFQRLKERGDLHRIGLKDLGAGGILCATVELVAELGFGAEVDLDHVHVGEENLPAAVIACAETQERFCFGVPPDLTDFILEHFNVRWDFPNVSAGAKASKIGKITAGGQYVARYQGEEVCNAKALDITEGIVVDRKVEAPQKVFSDVEVPTDIDTKKLFLDLLSSENVASLRPFSESYDQTVQGNTVLTRDETEAVVFTPLRDYEELSDAEKNICAAVAVAGPAKIGKIDPKLQGELAVVQSSLKVAAVGAEPLSLTDCLNYGNPEIPEQMWEFAEGITGVAESAEALNLPFVSGNVSLYNCSRESSVSPSAVVSCVGKISPEITPRKNGFQKEGNLIIALGNLSENLAGSEAERVLGNGEHSRPEDLDLEEINRLIQLSLEAKNTFVSTAVVAEGGMVSTLFKMAIRGKKGAQILADLSLKNLLSEKPLLIAEISPDDLFAIEELAEKKGISLTTLGEISGTDSIDVGRYGTFTLSQISDIFWGSLRQKR